MDASYTDDNDCHDDRHGWWWWWAICKSATLSTFRSDKRVGRIEQKYLNTSDKDIGLQPYYTVSCLIRTKRKQEAQQCRGDKDNTRTSSSSPSSSSSSVIALLLHSLSFVMRGSLLLPLWKKMIRFDPCGSLLILLPRVHWLLCSA